MNTESNIFVGGLPPDFVQGQDNATKSVLMKWFGEEEQAFFEGCIHSLSLQFDEIDFAKDPIRTANLVPCNG